MFVHTNDNMALGRENIWILGISAIKVIVYKKENMSLEMDAMWI